MTTTYVHAGRHEHLDKISASICSLNPKAARAWAVSLATAALLLQWQSAYAQNAYALHNLVSDLAGMADFTDTNLVNPWGIAFSATGPFWISDNRTGLSTLYNSSGTPQALVVNIPVPMGGTPPSKPNGMVFNNTSGFAVGAGQPGRFIFSTENGTIVAWYTGSSGVTKVDNSAAGVVYKGLALGVSSGSNYLYAANFFAGTIDVFDTNYNAVTLAGSFHDPSIPAGFAPFNIHNVNGQLYVAYAKQNGQKNHDVPGPGNGFVNIFDTSGNFVQRFASSNVLNSPWGIVVAPANFGALSGAVLIGNFGDGRINAFGPGTNAFLGSLDDASGNPLVIPGLWGLIVGNGGIGGDAHTIYFSAGIPGTNNIEDHGLFGSLSVIAPTITSITDQGLAAAFNWVSGTGPFLVQKKVNLDDSTWVDVLTTSSRSVTVAKESQTGFLRLRGQATNTVLPFTLLLNGASEMPPVATTATGVGALSLEGTNLTYYITFSGLSSPAIGAHIHAPASPTNSTGVVVTLSVPSATAGTMSGTVGVTPDLVAEIINGLAYVNIHTVNNGGGEIRSQIVPLHMVVTLNGASEVPPVATTGTGGASLTFVGSQLFYSCSCSNLSSSATAAHIHGPADPTGATNVIVPLATPSGTAPTISGTVTLSPTNLAYLLAGLTYMNIHTVNNGNGEIRGQIWPFQLSATLNAASEVPSTASPGTGSGQLTIVNSLLTYNFSFTNLLSAATGAHIHGPATATQSTNVLIPFSPPATNAGSFSNAVALTSTQLLYMVEGLTYANIHTTNYPLGEIRGQVLPHN